MEALTTGNPIDPDKVKSFVRALSARVGGTQQGETKCSLFLTIEKKYEANGDEKIMNKKSNSVTFDKLSKTVLLQNNALSGLCNYVLCIFEFQEV